MSALAASLADFVTYPVEKIALADFPTRAEALAFLLPAPRKPLFNNNRVEVTREAYRSRLTKAQSTNSDGSSSRADGGVWRERQVSVRIIADHWGEWPDHDETGIALLTLPEALQQILHITSMFSYDCALEAVNLGDHRVATGF